MITGFYSLTNSMMRDAILGYVQGDYLQAKNLKSIKLILNRVCVLMYVNMSATEALYHLPLWSMLQSR